MRERHDLRGLLRGENPGQPRHRERVALRKPPVGERAKRGLVQAHRPRAPLRFAASSASRRRRPCARGLAHRDGAGCLAGAGRPRPAGTLRSARPAARRFSGIAHAFLPLCRRTLTRALAIAQSCTVFTFAKAFPDGSKGRQAVSGNGSAPTSSARPAQRTVAFARSAEGGGKSGAAPDTRKRLELSRDFRKHRGAPLSRLRSASVAPGRAEGEEGRRRARKRGPLLPRARGGRPEREDRSPSPSNSARAAPNGNAGGSRTTRPRRRRAFGEPLRLVSCQRPGRRTAPPCRSHPAGRAAGEDGGRHSNPHRRDASRCRPAPENGKLKPKTPLASRP